MSDYGNRRVPASKQYGYEIVNLIIMLQHKRKYHYKGADTTSESRLFWIMVIVGLAIAAAIIFWL